MAIEVTPHNGPPTDGGASVAVLRAQPPGAAGDMVTVGDGNVSAAVTRTGLYRIYALSSVRVRAGKTTAGAALANANGGFAMAANTAEVVWLQKGDVVACAARA